MQAHGQKRSSVAGLQQVGDGFAQHRHQGNGQPVPVGPQQEMRILFFMTGELAPSLRQSVATSRTSYAISLLIRLNIGPQVW